uniref:Alpha-catulin n=1 Tax=Meloidogyne incognita TaxID=6306 RepID=A0A914L6N2_MELIC
MLCPLIHATMNNASMLRQHQHSISASAMSTSQHGSIAQQTIASNDGLPLRISPFYGPNFPQQNPVASTSIQQKQQTSASFDPRNLEIKTHSVEQTLLPLVQQISTLVNFKETILTGGRPKSDRALRAALKIGTAVEAAVERFVAVGETIADENPDIQPELYDACHEARIAGSSIANLHGSMLAEPLQDSSNFPVENGGTAIFPNVNTTQLVRAARQLLSSVTRVLLLADRVLVKHILRAEDKIAYSLTKLEHTSNFTEFVQIFTEFGGQMVDLAHRSGDRQQDLKSEKRQAQMQVARAQLERLTMLLLTSAKTLLRHPDDPAARQCRDGVFHQIRSALQLIAICVTDGVMAFDAMSAYSSPLDELSLATDGPLDIGIQLTASVAIRQLCEMLDMCRMMSLIGAGVRERLISALSALCEMSTDFTDSSWTPNQQREQILDLLEECRFEMGNLVNPPTSEIGNDERLRNESIQVTVERLNRRLKDLRKQLQLVALEQIASVFRQNEDQTLLSSLKTCSISGDIDGVERFLEQFRIHSEHLQEVCRLLHHISITDALHVFTGHAERNLRSLAPLTLLSGRILCVHPSSRIARENLEVFCDTWATNVNDLARLTKEIDAACSGRLAAEKQAYMSLPRPGPETKDGSAPKLCPNSAFTPYEKFINQQQEQPKTSTISSKSPQIFVYTSPPIRRQNLENKKDLKKSKSANGIVKFNRTGIGFDEPVILRQWEDSDTTTASTQDSSNASGYVTEYLHNSNHQNLSQIEENNNYATVNKKKPIIAPLAKCDEVDDDDEEDIEYEEENDGTSLEENNKNGNNYKNNFVVRMREKKAAKRHGTTFKPTKPITLDLEDHQKIAKVGLEMKLLTDEMEAEAENWDKYAENDIVKRAKTMSAMSYNMYLFTKGDGPLKTTHDLFTQAEFFAEQANKMHKTVKEFAFEVPGSAEKNDLLQILEKIPVHCQQLQVLVKSPTVGKTATFNKVDAVISETKRLMNEIAKLVTACFVCATKFEIEFRGNIGGHTAAEGDIIGEYSSQRASRESSAVWRRTPSMRRAIQPPTQHQQYLTAGGPSSSEGL